MSDHRRGSLHKYARPAPYSQPADRHLEEEEESDVFEESDDRPRTSSSQQTPDYASYGSTPSSLYQHYEHNKRPSSRLSQSEAESSRRGNYDRVARPNPSPSQQVSPPASTSQQPVSRPAQATRTSSATGTYDAGPVPMSETAIDFIEFSLTDLRTCATFVDENPNVLDEGLEQFKLAARRAFASGQDELARRVIHRLLIIKRCEGRSVREAKKYINGLAKSGTESDNFRDDYLNLVDTIKGKSGTARSQAAASAVSVLTESTITQRMEQATIGSTSASSTARVNPRRMSSSRGYVPPPALHEPQESGVRSAVQDASSVRTGAQGTTNNKNSLHAGYWVRKDDFFVIGKVFKVLWHQPAGADLYGHVKDKSSDGLFGEPIYSTLRWMVVVKSKPGYCICCPISTYGGKGLGTKKLTATEKQAHAVVFSHLSQPVRLTTEPKLEKIPIPVVIDNDGVTISPESRVHFGKYHTVEYNVKVMGVGRVHREYLNYIVEFAKSEF